MNPGLSPRPESESIQTFPEKGAKRGEQRRETNTETQLKMTRTGEGTRGAEEGLNETEENKR